MRIRSWPRVHCSRAANRRTYPPGSRFSSRCATVKADIGVVPVENTTAGTVSEVYDLLLDYDLYINRSYIKKISHCLAAVPGTKLEDVKRVCSHPHTLPQCHSFISARSGGHRGGEHRHCGPERAEKGRQEPCCHLLAGGGCALRSRYFSPRASTTCSTTKHALSPSAER